MNTPHQNSAFLYTPTPQEYLTTLLEAAIQLKTSIWEVVTFQKKQRLNLSP